MTAQQAFRNTVIVLATIGAAYVLYRSIHILIVLMIAILLASTVRPGVIWLTRHRISYKVAILIVYGGLGLALFTLSAMVIPPVTTRLSDYITNDQRLAARIITTQRWFEEQLTTLTGESVTLFDPEQIKISVSNTIRQVIAALPSIAGEFGSLFTDFILVVVMGIYWLTERDKAIAVVLNLFPLGRRGTINTIISETENSLSHYLQGIVFVSSFVGVANCLILTLLRVPDALMLGFIMGITTMLPLVGGYIGAGLSTLLALLISPLYGLFAFGSFVLVQQVENHYLTPRVMSRSVGLDPIIIIVSLFIGSALGGVVGALIAVPVAGAIYIILRHLIIAPRHIETTPQKIEGGFLLETAKDQPIKPDVLVEAR